MKEENPFDKVFDQIADLLALVQEKRSKPSKGKPDEDIPYEDIDEQLEVLEREVELFRLVTDEAMKESGISEETLKKYIENPPKTISRQKQRTLKRAKKLKGEAERLGGEFERDSKAVRRQKKKTKSAGKKRRKKFKRLGGTDWLPL